MNPPINTLGNFDPAKDQKNLEKHGLSLQFGAQIFEDDDYLIIPSVRMHDGEERFKIIGLVSGKLYTAVFVWRDDLPRSRTAGHAGRGD